MRSIFVAVFLAVPALALAQVEIPGFDMLPKPVQTGLSIVLIVQGVARLLAEGGRVVNGKTEGSGSGWFRFWNHVAAFPAAFVKTGGK